MKSQHSRTGREMPASLRTRFTRRMKSSYMVWLTAAIWLIVMQLSTASV